MEVAALQSLTDVQS